MKTKAKKTAVSMKIVIPGRLARTCPGEGRGPSPETKNTGFDEAGEDPVSMDSGLPRFARPPE